MAEGRRFERMYNALKAGEITRREFAQRALAMGMGGGVLAIWREAPASRRPQTRPTPSLRHSSSAARPIGISNRSRVRQ